MELKNVIYYDIFLRFIEVRLIKIFYKIYVTPSTFAELRYEKAYCIEY